MKKESATYWIDTLKLAPHPEGGFFKETYRSAESFQGSALPNRFGGDRNFSTAIYFLLRSVDKSHFHKIKSDELWHFYAGSSLTIFILNENGLSTYRLGLPASDNYSFQVVVPANSWFGAMVDEPDSFVLAGCTVSPGFDFRDFEMAQRTALSAQYPEYESIIKMLTN
jgi:uncharacterized protein